MRQTTIALAALFSFLSNPAFAACQYCTDRVVLTREMATCFQERMDKEVQNLVSSKSPAILVSLVDCPGARSSLRGGQSIPGGGGGEVEPTVSMLLDKEKLICLGRLVGEAGINWTPAAMFKLSEQCRQESK